AENAPLWGSTLGGMVLPLLQIACFEQVLYQSQKAVIGDTLAQDRQQARMVNVVEAAFDVSLDKPLGSRPVLGYLREGGVTAASRTEAVRGVRKLRFKVGFQKGAHHFLQQFI